MAGEGGLTGGQFEIRPHLSKERDMLDTKDIKIQAGPNRSIAVVVKDELGRVAGHLIRPDEARELARSLITLAAEMSGARGAVGMEHVEGSAQSAVSSPL